MIAQQQTVFGAGKGNCFSACIACFGLRYFEVDFGDWVGHELGLPDCYLIVSGPGPRDCDHATVWLGGNMVHDPHPSGAGLLTPKAVGVIVQLDPRLEARKAAANG